MLVPANELRDLANFKPLLVVVAGSTKTSTIPGISVAGPSPEATLYTPTLDVEYLLLGRTVTMNVIPVAPSGVPTPALITRAIAKHLGIPILVVEAGCYVVPRVPHVRLPSATLGGRIDVEPALPQGTSRRLFTESKLLGENLAQMVKGVVIGETLPGGTTTAAAILEALGYPGLRYISSSSPSNPRKLKEAVVRKALARIRETSGIWDIVDQVGDPVHVSLAGIACGALGRGARVYLAGGTQMAAVLAIMKATCRLRPEAILTTRWIVEDRQSNIEKLVSQISPDTPIVYSTVDFRDAPYEGLVQYEHGYAKEGVGAGGSLVIALASGLSSSEVKKLVYNEYARITTAKAMG
jgi:uncharacterized protein (TIGR00303 family)